MRIEIKKCDICGNESSHHKILSLDVFVLGGFELCEHCIKILEIANKDHNSYWTNEAKSTCRRLGEFASKIVLKQYRAKE